MPYEIAQESEVVQTLLKARQLIVERGWIQAAFSSEHGLCGVGAIDEADPTNDSGGDAALIALVRTVTPEFKCFAEFNDTPGRTADQILAKFDEAVALERSRA